MIDRIKKYITNRFESKEPVIEQKALSSISDPVLAQYNQLKPIVGESYSDSTAADAYRSWVYTASTYNANAVSSAKLELYVNKTPKVAKYSKITNKQIERLRKTNTKAITDETVEIISHPIIDLMNSPNEFDSLNSFLFKVDIFLELMGDAFILLTRGPNGVVVQMEVLFSQYVAIQTDGVGTITQYNYGAPVNGKWQYSFPPEDVIHIKFFDPSEQLYGISPLEACARSAGLIKSQTVYEEALNANMGVVSGIVNYRTPLKEDERKKVEANWKKKFASVGNSGKVVVTDNNVEYTQLGINPRDMSWEDGRRYCREDIFACFGVPTGLITTEATNYSNMISSSINYYHNTVEPRLRLISETLTNQLLHKNGIDGKNLFICLYREAPQDKDHELEKAKLLTSNSAISVNELRVMMDMDEVSDSYGNEYVEPKRNLKEGTQNV